MMRVHELVIQENVHIHVVGIDAEGIFTGVCNGRNGCGKGVIGLFSIEIKRIGHGDVFDFARLIVYDCPFIKRDVFSAAAWKNVAVFRTANNDQYRKGYDRCKYKKEGPEPLFSLIVQHLKDST